MEQLTQNLKNGNMQLLEVPFPIVNKGCVLVRNHFSVISAGTEGKTVKDARLGYIGKAMARKDEVKKVISAIKTIGLTETYKLTMNKLDAPSPLGYSCAGEVIGIADDVTEFKIGDKVACGGNAAVHSEVVSVPKNLCVKIEESVSLNEACFTTLGAIAIQGIRQADLRLGENCVVIGLGLIGQITMQLLNASGIKSIGIDIDGKAVELSKELGAELVFNRNTEGLEEIIKGITNGQGVDAVIITAATSSTDPVDFAGVVCRKKGKVVIVGAVPAGFKRANYYKKELELKMSSSYGPGRNDKTYEEHGIDYPYAYVRWTENRNMQAFAELLRTKKINLAKLTTHTFDFKEAPSAYKMILEKTENYLGIVLKYDLKKTLTSKIILNEIKAIASEPSIGLIGAGSFANNVLLPALKGKCNFIAVASGKSNNAKNIADKYGFSYCTDKTSEIIIDKNINTIVVATRHDSHGKFVLEALKSNKHVFVEKPLCISEDELEMIRGEKENSKALLMVGFNRRFAPQVQKAQEHFKNLNQPVSINYRINAGTNPADHWIHDKEIGGGRIVGELCHFVDLVAFIANSKIKGVSANSIKDPNNLNDTLVVNLSFENGSIASISYFSNGNKQLNKEYLEIFGSGHVVVIDDFKDMKIIGESIKESNLSKQDKGHKNEVSAFLDAIKTGKASPITFENIYNSMLFTFKIEESVKRGGALVTANS